MQKLNKETLDALYKGENGQTDNYIRVGMSACGIAAGAEDVYDILCREVKRRELSVEIQKAGCIGKCFAEPLVEVKIEGLPVVFYGRVNADIAVRILDKHVVGKKLVNDHIYSLKTGEHSR